MRRRYERSVPPFLKLHLQDHLRCLQAFFDVTLIDQDCDYLEICDQIEPDITLIETGPNLATCRSLRIKNIRSHSKIPKLGFLNCDGWCETRSGILSEMNRWGVEDFVSIAVTAAESLPAISDRLICWPNFIDPDVIRDYGQPKTTEVLLTGAQSSQYPWRARVFPVLSRLMKSTHLQHPGYYLNPGVVGTYGQNYARQLNAALFVPTCGTLAKEVVRKHFEIPGCGACLITEHSASLVAAGFVDMVNCVFDDNNLLDKMGYLIGNIDILQRITAAGHNLVHTCHTYRQRDQLQKWLELYKRKNPGERIVQENPFLSPTLKLSDLVTPRFRTEGEQLRILDRCRSLIANRNYFEAERECALLLGQMKLLPEARFYMALCRLYQGDAEGAYQIIWKLIEYTIVDYRAIDPDPVEWAYLIVCLLCRGRLKDASRRAEQYPWLTHVELDRARRAVATFSNRVDDLGRAVTARKSVHRMPERDARGWIDELAYMLEACGQDPAMLRPANRDSPAQRNTERYPRYLPQRTRRQFERWLLDPTMSIRLAVRFKNLWHRFVPEQREIAVRQTVTRSPKR